MTNTYRYLVIILLFCFCKTGLLAQKNKFDSLLSAFKRATQDTLKLQILFELVDETDNIKEKLDFNQQAERLSEKLIQGINDQLKITGKKGMIAVLDNKASFFAFHGDFTNAIENLNESLKIAEEINNKKLMALERSNVAMIYGEQGNFEEALKNLFVSLKISEEINNKDRIIDNYIRLGRIQYAAGKYAESLKSYLISLRMNEERVTLATQSRDSAELRKGKIGIVSSYNSIADIYKAQDNYDKAIEFRLSCMKIFEDLKFNDGIEDLCDELGSDYEKKSEYDKALETYFKMLKLCKNDNDQQGVATAYERIGFVYLYKKDFDNALMAQETSLKISEELDDEKGVADGFGDLADIYHEKGKLKPLNYDTALVYYFKALAIYNKLEFNTSIAEIKNEIAKIYFLKGKFKMAKEGAFLTLKVFKNVASKDEVRDNYLMLSRCDSALGNYKEAYRFYQLYNLYKDSIYEEKNDNGIIKQQIKFETDKVEKEIKTGQEKKDMLAKEEMRRQKLLRNGFMGGFGIVFLFSLVVYRQRNKVKREKKRSDELLLNILPAETAEELKATGYAEPKSFEEVTVMFTDFKNFTQASENMSAKELVQEINYCYCEFDRIISRHKIEKIKTMGDSYMCAGGLPVKNTTNATDVINAALEIQEFMLSERAGRIKNGLSFFEIRIGIHTGPVVAGIVGIKKFAYDIWGDTVNIASRMESSGEVGTVNISGSTFGFVKNTFLCTYRGKIEAKNKGMVDMYFVNREMAITV